MKKIRFSLVFALVLLATATGIKAQSQSSPFAGNWMMDKEKTNTTRDFPQKLKNFKMAVTGTEANLNVRSQIEGNVDIQTAGQGTRTAVTESASRVSGGQATGGSSSSANAKLNYGGTMALFFTPGEANYNLNGEEEKIETPQGLVRIKAKPDKSGKSLQFVIIRRMKTPTGEIEVITRESWKISEDGKTLKLFRTVETPTARDEITMYLNKV